MRGCENAMQSIERVWVPLPPHSQHINVIWRKTKQKRRIDDETVDFYFKKNIDKLTRFTLDSNRIDKTGLLLLSNKRTGIKIIKRFFILQMDDLNKKTLGS